MREDHMPAALPEAFLKRMRELLGEEYEAFVQSYEETRVQGLRLNTRKGERETLLEQNRERFGLRPVPWCREGFYYCPDTRPGRHPLHEAGVYYIQEPSAMAVVSLLDPQPGERVLDLCAAPGGKTTHIADRLWGSGLLISNEIHPARARILSRNVERMGIRNAVVMNEASEKLAEAFPEYFDRIVVDAPCSGEGMFRKDEQARTEWSEENVRLCAARQQEILDNGARLLRPGGRMVYSTCTFAPEENELQIARFLERHPEFSVVRVPDEQRLSGLSAGMARVWSDAHPELADTFRIWPQRAEGEGHYLALLEKAGGAEIRREQESAEMTEGGREAVSRKESEGAREAASRKESEGVREAMSRKESEGSRKATSRKTAKGRRAAEGKTEATGSRMDKTGRRILQEFLQDTLKLPETTDLKILEDRLLLFGEQIYLAPEGMPELAGLRVLRPGLHIGTIKKNRLEPSHALALALDAGMAKRKLCLPPEGPEVAAYLAGGTLSSDDGQKGWVLICAGEYPLGWGKASGGIVKNHYPKGLRIQQTSLPHS